MLPTSTRGSVKTMVLNENHRSSRRPGRGLDGVNGNDGSSRDGWVSALNVGDLELAMLVGSAEFVARSLPSP